MELHNIPLEGQSAKERIEGFLHNITSSNNSLNALIEVFSDDARNAALRIDSNVEEGNPGKIAGLVASVKDLICISNTETSAGSKILRGYRSTFNATVIERLLDQGAILIGRSNCDEFGMGSTGENSSYGATRNPLDRERVPGGSSSGSAASVQAGYCDVSIGTDTGGSVRQPAAFCNLIGLKPTYSRISRHGLIPYASSFDCVGIIGNNLRTVASVLEVAAGRDDNDSTSSSRPVDLYSQFQRYTGNQKLKIACLREGIDHTSLNEDIKDSTLTLIKELEADGNGVDLVDFPLLDKVLPTYYVLTAAEASSNLGRYDGIRYGAKADHMQAASDNLHEYYTAVRSANIGKEATRRIILGTFVLSASYYDDYYIRAMKTRSLIKLAVNKLFEEYDFIITPTSPTPPFRLGEVSGDPLRMYLADLYTVIASVCGIPAISVPNGHDSDGLPIGAQIMSPMFDEMALFSFSDYVLEANASRR